MGYAVLLTVADLTPPAKYPLEKVAVPLTGFVVVVVKFPPPVKENLPLMRQSSERFLSFTLPLTLV